MAAILEAQTVVQDEVTVNPRKLWTRAEYRQLTKDGFLQDGKVELINGEIWKKMGQGRRHTFVVSRIIKLLGLIFGIEHLQTQSSLPVNEDSEPEPDLAVLAKSLDYYLEVDPAPEDTLLVVEASNTTLRADLTVKQIMYAQSAIPEYWVVDIPNRLLHVFREPSPTGYLTETVMTPTDEVRPLAAPDAIIRVGDLLP
ncbi:MAG: Uma2 family endonuclease [Janthinobacterium lividum]